jgi:hypothetical protein
LFVCWVENKRWKNFMGFGCLCIALGIAITSVIVSHAWQQTVFTHSVIKMCEKGDEKWYSFFDFIEKYMPRQKGGV